MKRFLTIMLVCVTFCLPTPIWANDKGPIEHPAGWTQLLVDTLTSPAVSTVQPSGSLVQTSVDSTFALTPQAFTRLRDLSPETDSPRTKGLVAKLGWLKGTFVTETEIATSYGGADWLEHRMPENNRMDPSKQMVRLGLTGTRGGIKYGLTYREAGLAYFNAPDQGSREMWGEWKTNEVTLRSVVGQLWTNVAEDTARPRLVHTYGRMSAALAKPSWPELHLTYARNSFASMLEPIGVAPQHTQSHTLEGAVAYQSLRWNVRLTSSYALSSDLLRGGAESHVRMQLVSASFRPINTFSISPTLGYRVESQDASGTRIDGPSASLALHYKQSRRVLISAMANFASSRSNDRQIDNEHVGSKGILTWDVQRSSNWSTLIAIEAGYSRVNNRVTPSADTEDISGLVRIVLAEL
jgi:hypothetical protein